MRVENNTRKNNQSKVITHDTTSTCGITLPTSNTALSYKSGSTLEQNTFERDSSYLIYFTIYYTIIT